MLIMERAIRVTVSGRVHGVGFRYTTREAARRLGLEGWVRNRADGTVEAWAQGHDETVARFIDFLGDGPPAARVTSVEVEEATPDPELVGFRVRA